MMGYLSWCCTILHMSNGAVRPSNSSVLRCTMIDSFNLNNLVKTDIEGTLDRFGSFYYSAFRVMQQLCGMIVVDLVMVWVNGGKVGAWKWGVCDVIPRVLWMIKELCYIEVENVDVFSAHLANQPKTRRQLSKYIDLIITSAVLIDFLDSRRFSLF